jgi:sec-independent protein translocase protein TatB
MLDFSWSHLLIFAVAAIVLIPSKDLPKVLRMMGRYVGEARKMAHEFRSQVDDALRETELTDIKTSLEKEVKDIEKSASLAEAEQSLNATLNAASATNASTAMGGIVPSISSTLPVTAATAPVETKTAEAPAPEPTNGVWRPSADGIEVVRAGTGSVAQRAAAAWKKSPAGTETGV